MIPLYLKFSGLYSYQEEQEIDFEPLTQAQLFGIFGPVGSGKSSIMEAITIALYGKTDRLKHDVNYNALNLSSDRLLIDFTFKNYEGKVFRSIVETRRNSKRFEVVTKKKSSLFELVNGIPIPTERDIADIIKMSYENFRKTVIIPQGKFLEFLELTAGERSKMLKELFKLERFDLSQNAAQLKKSAEVQLSSLDGKLSTFAEISGDLLKSQELKYAQNQKDISDWTVEHISMIKEERTLGLLKQNYKELSSLKSKWEVLAAKSKAFEDRAKALKLYEYGKEHIEPLIRTKKELNLQIQKNEKLSAMTRLEVEQLLRKLKFIQKELEEIKVHHKEIPIRSDELEDIQEWIHIKRIKLASTEATERLSKGQALLDQNSKGQEKIQKEIAELEEQSRSAQKDIPDFTELSKVLIWHKEKNSLEKQKNQLIERSMKYTEKLHSSEQEILKEYLDKYQINTTEIGGLREQLSGLINALNELIKTIKLKLDNLLLHAKLEEFADAIQSGEPCPLCGSKDHPQLLSIEGVNKEYKKLSLELDQCEKLKSEYHKEESRIIELIASHEAKKKELIKSQERLTELDQQVVTHKENFTWQKFREFKQSEVQKLQALGQSSMDIIKTLDARKQRAKVALESLVQKQSKFQKRMQLRRDEKIKFDAEMKTRREQLKILVEEPQGDETELKKRHFELQEHIAFVLKRLDELNSEHELVMQAHQKKNQDLIHIDHHLEHDREAHKRNESVLKSEILKSPFDSEAEIESILHLKLDRENEQKEIRLYEDETLITKNRLNLLEDKLKNESYDPVKHEILEQRIISQDAKIKSLEKETAKMELSIQETKKDLEIQASLTKERELMHIRFEGLSDLVSLFSGAKFINFISRIYLKEVCQIANRRFKKLTRKTLELALSPSNDFLVVDYLNGAKERKVSSLSGGQKFQAALSLALALAESVQNQLGNRQNFFFIDEGFGTLDKTSMQDAVKTLTDLRKEGRIVGIISHIESLQDEVDIFLGVKNDPERGSLIKRSWV